MTKVLKEASPYIHPMLLMLNLFEAEKQGGQSFIISDIAAEKALSFQKDDLSILPLNLKLVRLRRGCAF